MTAAHVGENLMRMRPFLTSRIGPGAIADALEQVSHGADRPIGKNPINREVAGPIVGRVEKLSRRVNVDVSGELPVRRRGVEEGEISVCRVDGIRTHAPRSVFVDGVEERLRRVKGKERWVGRGNNLHRGQPTITRVQPENIDANGNARMSSAGGNAGSCVGAHVDESRRRSGRSSGDPAGRRADYTGGSGCYRGRAEQWKKLATSQARRQRFLIILGFFQRSHDALLPVGWG